MWITRKALDLLVVMVDHARADALRAETRAAQADTRTRQHAAIDGEYIRRLHERLISAEGDARAAQARADLMTVRVNTLEMERATLLAKFTGVQMPVAQVGHAPVIQPGADPFNDPDEHPDEAPDRPIAAAEQVDGMVGRVFDPRAGSLPDADMVGGSPSIFEDVRDVGDPRE